MAQFRFSIFLNLYEGFYDFILGKGLTFKFNVAPFNFMGVCSAGRGSFFNSIIFFVKYRKQLTPF